MKKNRKIEILRIIKDKKLYSRFTIPHKNQEKKLTHYKNRVVAYNMPHLKERSSLYGKTEQNIELFQRFRCMENEADYWANFDNVLDFFGNPKRVASEIKNKVAIEELKDFSFSQNDFRRLIYQEKSQEEWINSPIQELPETSEPKSQPKSEEKSQLISQPISPPSPKPMGSQTRNTSKFTQLVKSIRKK